MIDMTEKVYKISKEESQELNKLLGYDPYLDNSLIPTIPEQWTKEDYLEAHPDIKEKAEELNKKREEALNKLKTDKDLNTIFARQRYEFKDGSYFKLDSDKYYLYLNADDQFLKDADDLLKRKFKTIEDASEGESAEVIKTVNEDESKADAGVGFLFG